MGFFDPVNKAYETMTGVAKSGDALLKSAGETVTGGLKSGAKKVGTAVEPALSETQQTLGNHTRSSREGLRRLKEQTAKTAHGIEKQPVIQGATNAVTAVGNTGKAVFKGLGSMFKSAPGAAP